MISLFGDTIPDKPGLFKQKQDRAHPATPGSGPDGETCRTCAHLARLQYSKTYLKCDVIRKYWTSGAATDVKAGDPACSFWKSIYKHNDGTLKGIDP